MGGTHFLQTGYLLLNRNAPCFPKENATAFAGAEDFPPCFPKENATAFAGAEDFPPCFSEKNATAFAGAEDFPPCFSKKNATAFAGAEDFSPCFADFCGSGSDFSTATSTQNLIFTYLPLLSENLYTSNNRSP